MRFLLEWFEAHGPVMLFPLSITIVLTGWLLVAHRLVCLALAFLPTDWDVTILSFDQAFPHPNDLLLDDRALPVTYEGPSCPNKNKVTTTHQ
jgi:hypothetical protein